MNDEDREHYRIPGSDWKPDWTLVAPNADQLQMISRIESEFAKDGPNRGLTWIQGEMLDNRESDEVVAEGAAIGHFDRWQAVSDALIARFPSAWNFLDDPGLRFHLPAVMRWVLRLGLHWSAPALDGIGDRALELPGVCAMLSDSQRAVIEEWNLVRLPDHLRSQSK